MADTIQARLFGPGLSPQGKAVHFQVQGSNISISVDGAIKVVRLEDLEATVGGFDHDQLQLQWSRDSEACMLVPADKLEQKKLVDALPAQEVRGLKRWKAATWSQSFVWRSIAASVVLVCVAVAVGFWQYDRIAGWIAHQIPMKTELAIGESVLQSLNADARYLSKGPAVEAVQKIGDRLTHGSRYQYRWYVAKDKQINAFAIPGGIIVVNSGLLEKADTANELAAVLAHEVQHVEERHALRNMIASAGLAGAVLLVLGDANTAIMIVAHQVSAQYFNRQVESEADIKGIELLHNKNIDAQGMVSFFRKMKTEAAGRGDMPVWLSSHPDTQNRIAIAQAYLAKRPCPKCTSLDWDKAAVMQEVARIHEAEGQAEK